tara:strand:+ start:627 stop:785 length:159 start_codon:yes stop_codon:yes gene_type:complete
MTPADIDVLITVTLFLAWRAERSSSGTSFVNADTRNLDNGIIPPHLNFERNR